MYQDPDYESTRALVSQLITNKFRERQEAAQQKPKQDFTWADEFDDQPVELTQLLRSMMNANNREMAKVFVNAWFRMACHGNRTAIRELLIRIEGPKQSEGKGSE